MPFGHGRAFRRTAPSIVYIIRGPAYGHLHGRDAGQQSIRGGFFPGRTRSCRVCGATLMAKLRQGTPAEPDREPRAQFATLPWRRNAAGGVEMLVITSRETHRWVIPKGWPIKGLKSGPSAAREAFEEAGVTGELSKKPLGVYHYEKRLRSGRVQAVRVAVYALKVTREAEEWPEKGQREKAWIPVAEASARVDEPELKGLLARFKS